MTLQRQGARLYMQRLICFIRSACKLISQWICSQNQPICQPALLSNATRRRLKSQCFCMCIVGFFLRIALMSGLLLLATGRAMLMSPEERNASRDGLVQTGWVVLIVVSWHIHFNKLLMPLTPICCFAN